jgi:hypothetical protein
MGMIKNPLPVLRAVSLGDDELLELGADGPLFRPFGNVYLIRS